MSVKFITTYPAALTNAAWQKKKSLLDKTKGKTKTGLGAHLTKAQNAWNDINFNLLKAEGQNHELASDWDKAKQAAQDHYDDKVKAAKLALEDAVAAAKIIKKNSGLSATAKEAAEKIQFGLEKQIVALIKMKFDDFDSAKNK